MLYSTLLYSTYFVIIVYHVTLYYIVLHYILHHYYNTVTFVSRVGGEAARIRRPAGHRLAQYGYGAGVTDGKQQQTNHTMYVCMYVCMYVNK